MWNNPEVLGKLGKAMGGVFDFEGALEAGEAGEGEEEEDGEVEETVHGAASAGEQRTIDGRGRCGRGKGLRQQEQQREEERGQGWVVIADIPHTQAKRGAVVGTSRYGG